MFTQKTKNRLANLNARRLALPFAILLVGFSPEATNATPAITNASPATLRAATASAPKAPTADALAPLVRAGTPLLIDYNGAERLIHPYRLGTNPRTGKPLLRAWEETKADQPTNAFRTYEVAKITRAQTLPGHAPIDLPPQAYAPDKTIPSPIAERPRPQKQ